MSFPRSFLSGLHSRAEARAEGCAAYLRRYHPCESPIEELFLVAFYLAAEEAGGVVFGAAPDGDESAWFTMSLQETILRYRADFVVGLTEYPSATRIVVECDGHDFHERTKEQAARDRKRDREMQAAGYRVFRFTGSEIYRDPFKCADEVLQEAMHIHGKMGDSADV